jgi:hypothetical protein
MTIVDKAMLGDWGQSRHRAGADRGSPQQGAKGVDAGTHRPLAHPEGRVTLLTLQVTSAAQIQAAADQQGRRPAATPAGYEQRGTRVEMAPPWRKRCTTGSWTG